MSYVSSQLQTCSESTLYSILEEMRFSLLKVVRGITLFVCSPPYFVCLQGRTRQKPLRMWAIPTRPARCFPECLLAISSKTRSPSFYNLIVLPLLTSPFRTSSYRQGLPLLRRAECLVLSSKVQSASSLQILTLRSLNYYQFDVFPAARTTRCLLRMALLYHWVCLRGFIR